jgi:glycosyltransferase involved in cell wall biosynthesis
MKESPTKTICFFNSNKAWGGGEKWHFTTAKEFQRRGYKVILATNNRSELYKKAVQEKLHTQPFHVNNLSFLNPIKVFTMALYFKAHGVDAIILNLPSDLKFAGLAAKLAGVKRIIYRRGMPHPLRNTWLNRFLFKKILTHVVVNSQEIGRSLKQGNEDWFPEDKMVLIYNGVDLNTTVKTDKKVYVKKGEEIVIGNAGRLTEQKGQHYLIEMAELLKKDGVNFKVIIAGEGELRGELTKSIEAKGLTNEVILLGHVEDMPAFFNSLDVFVFTSLYEGSANTLIETLQYGVPCVAWDVSSNPEVIEKDMNGILCKPFDINELKDKTLYFGVTKTQKNELMSESRKAFEQKFDSKKNLDILQELI